MLVCEKCKGTNIEMRAWVDANRETFLDSDFTDELDNWCRDCEEHVNFIKLENELSSRDIAQLLIHNFNDYKENIEELLTKLFNTYPELKKSWSGWFKGVNNETR